MSKPEAAPIEAKVARPAFASVVTGLLTWALVTFIPAWKAGIPSQLEPFIPFAVAWLTSSVTGYLAPHTHRPDLAAPAEVAVYAPEMDADDQPPPGWS